MSVFNRMRPQPAQSAGAARRLFVRLAGSGSGRPLVLLHGLASSSRYWLPYTRLLGGRSLVLPDLLGFGRSPKPVASEYSPRAHIAALQAALERLRPRGVEPPFDLLGQSAGSLVALLYATACPEDIRRVGLISLPVISCLPWGHRADGSMLPQHRLGVHTRWGPRLASGIIRLAGPLGRLVAPRIQRDVPPDAARDALSVSAQSYWRTLERVVYGSDAAALVAQLRGPLLLVHGTADRTAPIEPVRELAALRPDTRLFAVPGAGHNPLVSHPALVAAALTQFFDEP